jgi:hypothetical protein
VCFIRDRKRYAQSIQQEGREVWRNARACTNSCGQGPSNALVWPIMSLAEVIANCAYSRKVVAGKSVSGLGSVGQGAGLGAWPLLETTFPLRRPVLSFLSFPFLPFHILFALATWHRPDLLPPLSISSVHLCYLSTPPYARPAVKRAEGLDWQ